jgi:outer membrane protein
MAKLRMFSPCRASVLLASCVLLVGGQCCAEDLLTVYREAVLQDPTYDAARYAYEAAEQKLPQARAGLLPTLSLSGGKSLQHGPASFNEAAEQNREVRNRNWSLQLSQPLLHPANWAALSQAHAQVRAAAAQLNLARQELILRSAQAFFDILLAMESMAVADGQHVAVEQQWILARRNFEVGVATITDVHEAKSRLDLSRSQKIAATNDLAVKRAELEKLIGRPAGPPALLMPEAVLPAPAPANVEAWVEMAASANPQMVIQEAIVESMEYEVSRNRAAHAPTLDLTASHGKSYASGSMTSPEDIPVRTRSAQVGVQLTIPIWSGGGTQSRVAEATAYLAKARAEREAARRQAVTTARQAFSAVVNGQAQIEALSSAVVSSQSSVEANKIGYRIGTRINIDVLNAEQQLYATRRDLAKARIETLMQGLRLKAAVGTLDEPDVAAVNQLLVAL